MPKKSSKKKSAKKVVKKTTKKTTKKISKKTIKKTKNSAIKKAPAKNKKSFSKEKNKLLKDLNAIVNELNEEKLMLLVHQASVFRHNMKVDQLQDEQEKILLSNENRVEKTVKPQAAISIREGEDNSYFVININNYSSFFSLEEMKKMVKLCHASADKNDAASRIYKWLSRERSDVIRNNHITGPRDEMLMELYNLVISRYSVKV